MNYPQSKSEPQARRDDQLGISLEIVPVMENGRNVEVFVPNCGRSIWAWAVYERLADGTAEHAEDFETSESANAFANSFKSLKQ